MALFVVTFLLYFPCIATPFLNKKKKKMPTNYNEYLHWSQGLNSVPKKQNYFFRKVASLDPTIDFYLLLKYFFTEVKERQINFCIFIIIYYFFNVCFMLPVFVFFLLYTVKIKSSWNGVLLHTFKAKKQHLALNSIYLLPFPGDYKLFYSWSVVTSTTSFV